MKEQKQADISRVLRKTWHRFTLGYPAFIAIWIFTHGTYLRVYH